MSLALEAKKRLEHKMTAAVSLSEASELKNQAISQTFIIHKGKTGHNLYFVTTFAKPLAKEFGKSSQIALPQQYLLKYRESLFALRHNLKFIITAAKINQTMPLKSATSGKVEQTPIDLNYLTEEFKFHHSPLTLVQNRKKSENIAITIDESFNKKMAETLKTSKLIIETLLKNVNKETLTPEDIRAKEQLFDSADNIIKLLETEKISLNNFQKEILKENTISLETK